MNPLEFYCLILKNMDKNLAKKLGKIEKKYTNVPFENDEIRNHLSRSFNSSYFMGHTMDVSWVSSRKLNDGFYSI